MNRARYRLLPASVNSINVVCPNTLVSVFTSPYTGLGGSPNLGLTDDFRAALRPVVVFELHWHR